MMMADKTLEIIMKVRDLASQPIRAIGMAMTNLRDRMSDTSAKGGGLGEASKALGDLGKVAKVIGAIEIGAKTATAAIDGFGAAVLYMRGDIDRSLGKLDSFQAKLKEIPIIGAAAGLGQSIREMFSGEQAELDATNAAIKKQEERANALAAAYKAVGAAKAQALSVTGSAQNTVALLAADPADREGLQITQEADAKGKAIAAARREAEKTLTAQKVAAGGPRANMDNIEAEVRRELQPFADAQAALMHETNAKLAAIVEKSQDRYTDTMAKGEAERTRIMFETQAEQARQNGDALTAQVLAIKQSYAEQQEAIAENAAKLLNDNNLTNDQRIAIQQNAQDTAAALDAQMKAKIAGLERDTYADRARIVADGEAALLNLQSEARERRLQAEGKTLEASLERIKRSYDEQGKAIAKALEEQLENLPKGGEEEQNLRANAAARIKQLQEMRDLEEEQAALMDKQKSPRTNLGNFRLGEGRTVGAWGGGLAGVAVGNVRGGAAGAFGPPADPAVAAQQKAAEAADKTSGNTSTANELLKQLIEAVKGTSLEPMNP